MSKRSFIWSIPSEEFKKIIKESYSFNEVSKKSGFKHAGNSSTVKKRIKEENIDTTHFLGIYVTKGKKIDTNGGKNYPKLEDLLKKNNGYNIQGQRLKKKLIKANIFEDICFDCKIGPIWNNKPITLQLEHIDGDHDNNELSNLRILCPNCHSQTTTWCATKNKKIFNDNYQKYKKCDHNILLNNFKELPFKNNLIDFCINCNINEISIKNKSKLCKSCLNKSKIKYNGLPSLEQLEKDIKELNYTQTGKKYNVSDNTIRKWLNKLKKLNQ